MQKSRVLAKLRKGQPVLCTKTNFNEAAIVEMVGLMGFDCLWICQEHLWANPETLAGMITAGRATGMDVMVRIAKAGYSSAIRPLEMGAKGLMVPHILSTKDAETWVKATRFFPIGRRGLDGVNADADWGLMSFSDYMRFSNEETFLAVQIEDPEALCSLEEIVSIPGVDIIFVGIGDLSHSLGFPGDVERPEIWDILNMVAQISRKHGKFAGAPGISLEWSKKLLDLGYLFISNGADIILLRDAFLRLREDYRRLGFSFEENGVAGGGRGD